jgi:NAD(P)-dependent dehydrogenase (short-subunit alcohol dehydrogenase family)
MRVGQASLSDHRDIDSRRTATKLKGRTMNRLADKVAIITGGAGGLGAACAERFAAEGAKVVVADVVDERAQALATRLGGGSIALHFDCGEEGSIRDGIEEVVRRFGKIDILFNNAAAVGYEVMTADTTAPEISMDVWNLIMKVNVTGVMLGCKYAIPHMVKNGGGSIINTASDSALAGDNVRIAYGTSKAAVVALTKYVATQHGLQGIRCNAICPGPIGKPADIAAMAAYLAADESEYVTGQAISVDGGHLAHQPQIADMRTIEAPNRC